MAGVGMVMLPLHDERYAELPSCPRVAPPSGPGGADMRWLHVCEEPMSARADKSHDALTLFTEIFDGYQL